MKRNMLTQIGLLLCGCAAGLASAHLIVRAVQLHVGLTDLGIYATGLLGRGDHLAHETDEAVNLIATDNLPFCSDQELALMRKFVYNATDVRDIGRVKDHRLYCSTGIGRLATPTPMHTPDIEADDIRVFTSIPLVIAKHTTGLVTETRGVSIVVNPATYTDLDEGPYSFTGYFFDRTGGHVFPVMGHPVPLTSAEVIAARRIERNGIFYLPLCGQQTRICIVAAESRAVILSRNHPLSTGFQFAGGLLGTAFALIVILIYRRQQSLEQQLRRAIREDALTLAYQPIMDLATETIVGAEALVRWINDDGESVRPDVFIALAEARGFVDQITRFIVQRALEEFGDLLATGAFRIMLNIAAQDLIDPDFMVHLESTLEVAHVPPSSIGIEITERSTVDHEASAEALARLKGAGHPIYLDDFGTGYSNLAYLHLLAVDAIKIDRSFTQTVGTDAVTASVVPQILDMAVQLDLQVAVEGIETKEQADYFRKAGRGILGQGWLFSKPVSAAQFRRLLQAAAAKSSSAPAA
jgi:sensor c-di-GMP phosphodiesterase-like protein